MSKDDGTCNRDYFIQQYPDLADVFQPKTKAQQSFATPNPLRKRKAPPKPLPLTPEMVGDVMVIKMPLPPKELSPNGRAVWQRKANATKAARSAVALQVRCVVTSEWLGCSVRLDVRRWADKRMDNDNCWASLKSHRDGIADGLQTTDAQFELGEIEQITGKAANGRREMEFRVSRITRTEP